MINRINLFSNNVYVQNTKSNKSKVNVEAKQQTQTNGTVLPHYVAFLGKKSEIAEYDREFGVKFQERQDFAEALESKGLFYSANKQYKQNYKEMIGYIDEKTKNDGFIYDLKVCQDLTRITSCLCSNLCALNEVSMAKNIAKKTLTLALSKFSVHIINPEEKYLDALVKIDMTLNPSDVEDFEESEEDELFDENVNLPQLPNNETPFEVESAPKFENSEANAIREDYEEQTDSDFDDEKEADGWVDAGALYFRTIEDKDGKEKIFHSTVGRKQVKRPIKPIPLNKAIIDAKKQKTLIERLVPEHVSLDYSDFNIKLEEAFDKYQDLSLYVAGEYLKQGKSNQAMNIVEGLEQFFVEKDSNKKYWINDSIEQKKIEIKEKQEFEATRQNVILEEDESIDAMIANTEASDNANPMKDRIFAVETLAKLKSYGNLANIALSNTDENLRLYSVYLMINSKDELASKMLRNVFDNTQSQKIKENIQTALPKYKTPISFTGKINYSKNSDFDIVSFVESVDRAKTMEEAGYFFDAGKVYKKTWLYAFDYIKKNEKEGMPPINPSILMEFKNITKMYCENLCARGKIGSAANYANAAYDKIYNNMIIDEEEHNGETMLDKYVLEQSAGLAHSLSNGKPVYRVMILNGRERRLIDVVEDKQVYKEDLGLMSDNFQGDSYDDVKSVMNSFKDMINLVVPTKITPLRIYNPEISEYFDNYTDIGVYAVNMLLKKPSIDSKGEASALTRELVEFLSSKDPHQIYWEKSKFETIQNRIDEVANNEIEIPKKGYPEDFETLEAYIGAKDATLKPSQRLEYIEKLTKLKSYNRLTQLAFENIDKHSNYGVLYSLSRVSSPDAQQAILDVYKQHPDENVREKAKSYLR